MAITMQPIGLDQVYAMLNELGQSAQGAAGLALYEGAGAMADSINAAAAAIVTEPFRYARSDMREPSPEEKAIVMGKAGIAKFEKNGSEVNTSVGYSNAGYAMLGKKKKPIPQIAASINSGTSFMKKQPFIRRGAKSGKAKAESAITNKINEIFNKITGGK